MNSILMSNRGELEALVISVLLQDLSLMADISLKDKDFKFPKTKFFYGLTQELSKKYKEINEATVAAYVSTSPSLKESYDRYGGWQSVANVLSMGSIYNFNQYIDDLEKSNLLFELDNKGFNLEKEIEINNRLIKPIDLFPNMSATQVYEFYEMLLADTSLSSNVTDDIVIEDIVFSDEEIEKKKEGGHSGTPYTVSVSWEEDGKEKYITACPSLSSLTNGVTKQNGVYTIAGTSGIGKTTWLFTSLVLPLVHSGSKVAVFSNEQTSDIFKDMLLTYICKNVFRCYTINRKKVKSWDLTNEETEVVNKARKFIDSEFKGKIKFIGLPEFSMDKIFKVSKKLIISEGFDTICIDTFKSESESENTIQDMVLGMRDLDSFGKKMDVKVIATMQIATYAENKVSYLSASELSGSKQTKETMNVLLLFRKIANDIELNKDNKKYYLRPYRYKQDALSKKPVREDIELDPNKKYLLCFLNKNREGSDGNILIYSFDGHSGRFIEEGYAGHVSRSPLSFG